MSVPLGRVTVNRIEAMSILDYRSPEPPDQKEPIGKLLGIALAAFVAYWVVTPALYQLLVGRAVISSSQPTSQSMERIEPRDLVVLSIAAPFVGLATLIIG